jgi:hypothetical protein
VFPIMWLDVHLIVALNGLLTCRVHGVGSFLYMVDGVYVLLSSV